jgi:hypothetical protein
MEATPITRYHRRFVRLLVRLVVIGSLAALGAGAAVACALPNPAVFFSGIAMICVAVPLLSLVIGWPILLIFGGKAALDLLRCWRRNASHGRGERSTP